MKSHRVSTLNSRKHREHGHREWADIYNNTWYRISKRTRDDPWKKRIRTHVRITLGYFDAHNQLVLTGLGTWVALPYRRGTLFSSLTVNWLPKASGCEEFTTSEEEWAGLSKRLWLREEMVEVETAFLPVPVCWRSGCCCVGSCFFRAYRISRKSLNIY